MHDWNNVLDHLNDPARTRADLDALATALGVPHPATLSDNQLRASLRRRIAREWIAGNPVTPAVEALLPAPVAPPAPALAPVAVAAPAPAVAPAGPAPAAAPAPAVAPAPVAAPAAAPAAVAPAPVAVVPAAAPAPAAPAPATATAAAHANGGWVGIAGLILAGVFACVMLAGLGFGLYWFTQHPPVTNSGTTTKVEIVLATPGPSGSGSATNGSGSGNSGNSGGNVVTTNTGNSGGSVIPSSVFSQRDALSFDQFKVLVHANPYEMINRLDRLAAKNDRPVSGWTVSAGRNELIVIWTGIYDSNFDPTFGGKVDMFRVDGRTGVYLVLPGNTVTLPSPGGWIKVTGVTADNLAALRSDTNVVVDRSVVPTQVPLASACVAAKDVIAAINDNKRADPGRIYTKLDEIVNARTDARLRSNGGTVQGKNTRTLLWVQDGRINGNVLVIDQHQGKALYLVTSDGNVEVPYPHSGVQTCEDVNPQRDFPWWGK